MKSHTSKKIKKCSGLMLAILLAISLLIIGCSKQVEVTGNEKAVENEILTIPHPVNQLDNCLSCHQEGSNGAPKTPHPERNNCTDCHKEK